MLFVLILLMPYMLGRKTLPTLLSSPTLQDDDYQTPAY